MKLYKIVYVSLGHKLNKREEVSFWYSFLLFMSYDISPNFLIYVFDIITMANKKKDSKLYVQYLL